MKGKNFFFHCDTNNNDDIDKLSNMELCLVYTISIHSLFPPFLFIEILLSMCVYVAALVYIDDKLVGWLSVVFFFHTHTHTQTSFFSFSFPIVSILLFTTNQKKNSHVSNTGRRIFYIFKQC